MDRVEKNHNITLSYTLRDWGGEILEQAPHNNPLTYLHGYHQILPALEEALEGKETGTTVEIRLTSDEAFGPFREELIRVVDRSELEHLSPLRIGMELERVNGRFEEFRDDFDPEAVWHDGEEGEEGDEGDFSVGAGEEDEPFPYAVREIFEESVLLDGNHYLAGYDLAFELKILRITPASYDEIEQSYLKFGPGEGPEDEMF